MKKQLILMLGLMVTLSLSSCTSKSEDSGLPISTTATSDPTTTSSVEPTIPQTESDGSVEQSTEATETLEVTETLETTEGEVTPYASIEDIPKEIYDPDSTLSVTEQLTMLEEPYEKGLITDEQLDIIADQLFNKGTNSTTGSSTSNDTYIPAHGNPGTPDTGEILGYEGSLDDAPDVSNSRLD